MSGLRMSQEEFLRYETARHAGKPAPAPSATKRMQAKGRLPAGQMNESEKAYAEVLEARKRAGEVEWWVFEGIRLNLAPRTTLTPDFVVMLAGGELQLHDVKGAKAIIQEDAKVKMKVARAKFPFALFYVFPPKRKGGEWTLEEV